MSGAGWLSGQLRPTTRGSDSEYERLLAATGVVDARAKAVVLSYGRLIFAKWTGLQQLDIIPNQSVAVVLDGDG